MYKINLKYEILLPILGSLIFFDSLVGLLFLLSTSLIYLRYKNFSLDIKSDHVLITKGLWNRSQEKIYFNKINKVSYIQNPIQRHFKVSSISIETGNEAHRLFHSIFNGDDLVKTLDLKIKSQS